MQWELNDLTIESQSLIDYYASLRPICTCEGHFMCHYLWSGYYHTKYYVEEHFLVLFGDDLDGNLFAMMPLCKEKDLISVIYKIEDYFHTELKMPLNLYLLDKLSMGILQGDEAFLKRYEFKEDRDSFDYIYDAEKLRTLSGKKYHKKKNHINQFKKRYEGCFTYRSLDKTNLDEILSVYNIWLENHQDEDRYHCEEYEKNGIKKLLNVPNLLGCKMGGIYIDHKLEAFSIGSYNQRFGCAFIHMEKANIQFQGLYNYINQQFLIHEFPEARYVNREDDLGQEGLRKSKLSYKPLFLAEKYYITEK